jgi:hypothetical protein
MKLESVISMGMIEFNNSYYVLNLKSPPKAICFSHDCQLTGFGEMIGS